MCLCRENGHLIQTLECSRAEVKDFIERHSKCLKKRKNERKSRRQQKIPVSFQLEKEMIRMIFAEEAQKTNTKECLTVSNTQMEIDKSIEVEAIVCNRALTYTVEEVFNSLYNDFVDLAVNEIPIQMYGIGELFAKNSEREETVSEVLEMLDENSNALALMR